MDLRQLRYFLTVAEAGQLTAAAVVLGIQQPPLSQQIQALERELGMRLFERHPKGVSLTEGGHVLAREARRLLADYDAMQLRIAAVARGEQGVLQVAFTSSAAAHGFTPLALRACRERYPGVTCVVSELNAADITAGVADGRLHCGLLRVPVARPEGVVVVTLLTEPVVAALPVGHPLARRSIVRLQDFDDQPVILVRRPGAPGLYANLLARCAEGGATPRVVAEVERMMTSLNLVAAGVGLTVVPASMAGAHPQAIVYRPLPRDAQLDAPLSLLYRADRHEGALRNFIALVTELAEAQRAQRRSPRPARKPRR
jgi:DNA-binding transcriptional LysR family regulator